MMSVSPTLNPILPQIQELSAQERTDLLQSVVSLIDTPVDLLPNSLPRSIAGLVFDAGTIVPITKYSLNSLSLSGAFRTAGVAVPTELLILNDRSGKVFSGTFEQVENLITQSRGGDEAVMVFDKELQFLIAFNHSGAMSYLLPASSADSWSNLAAPSKMMAHGCEITNVSNEPTEKVLSWLPHDLVAERVIFLPDVCPSDAPLPTGTVVITRDPNWRKYAISDCGCGMQLLKTNLSFKKFSRDAFTAIAQELRDRKGQLGDLGGGNHFLDALVGRDDRQLYFLIHTGSRSESGHVEPLVDQPLAFDKKFAEVFAWARSNRDTIAGILTNYFGPLQTVTDLPHNLNETLPDGSVVIRKGAIKAEPGDLVVIPSSMSGDVVIATATPKVSELAYSLSHGTGRLLPRSAAKELATPELIAKLRGDVFIPAVIDDSSLRSEIPQAYRPLDYCLASLRPYIEEQQRLQVVAYLGHL
jgi:hypothetical protein